MLTQYLAFFKKDFLNAYSYKLQFFGSIFSIFFNIFIFFNITNFLAGDSLEINTYGNNNFFPYILLGICLMDLSIIMVSTLSNEIQNYKLTGTFEEIFILPISNIATLLASYFYAVSYGLIRLFSYLFIAIFFFEFNSYAIADLGHIIVCIILFFISYIGIGLIAASFSIIFHKANFIPAVHIAISLLAGGVFYPPSQISPVFELVSYFLPIVPTLSIFRNLYAYDINNLQNLTTDFYLLFGQSIFYFLIGLFLCKYSLARARKLGTLLYY